MADNDPRRFIPSCCCIGVVTLSEIGSVWTIN